MTASAIADNDGATISSYTDDLLKGRLVYGVIGDAVDDKETTWQLGQLNGDGKYTYSWTLYGLQGATDLDYSGRIDYSDSTADPVTWTQPARIANDGDIVVFPDLLKSRIAKIMTLCTKFAQEGEALTDEWQTLRVLVFATSWFNEIIVDG